MVEWRVHGERRIYESPWVNLALATVEPPGVEPFEHHVIRAPGPAAGCVITRDGDADDEVLLIYRHRFITDTWGWEIPAGGVDAGESPADGAVREAREETGWQPIGEPTPVITFHPAAGFTDHTFCIFHCRDAEHVGDPSDPTEASKIEWVPISAVLDLIRSGRVTDGLSLTALTAAIALGVITPPAG